MGNAANKIKEGFNKIKHGIEKGFHDVTHPKDAIKDIKGIAEKIADVAKHPKDIGSDIKHIIGDVTSKTGIGIPDIGGGSIFGQITGEFGGEFKDILSSGSDLFKESTSILKESTQLIESGETIAVDIAKDLPKILKESEELIFDEGERLIKAIVEILNLTIQFIEEILKGFNYAIEPSHIKYTAIVVLLAFLYMYRYKQ